MRLPMQSQPVWRTIPSQPFAHRDTGGAADGERGIQPSAYGVQPSAWWNTVLDVVKTAAPIALSLL